MHWIISDTHFGHENIIRFCNRPFNNANDMDEQLLTSIDRHVDKYDTLWHLGDFAYGPALKRGGEKAEQYLKTLRKRIKCQNIHLIQGNHDSFILKHKSMMALFSSVQPYFIGYVCGMPVAMCHRPLDDMHNYHVNFLKGWLKAQKDRVFLHGHTHNNSHQNPCNMSVENIHYMPQPLDSVIGAVQTWEYFNNGQSN